MKTNFPRNFRYADILEDETYQEPTRLPSTNAKKSDHPVAIKAAQTLRELLQPSLPFPNNKKMQDDFAKVIMKWMKTQSWKAKYPAVNLSFIHGFSFNERIPLYQCWRLKVSITKKRNNLLQLEIPAFVPTDTIWAPDNTQSIECIISIASCTLKNGAPNGHVIFPMSIPYNSGELSSYQKDIPISTPEGSLVIAAASINYIVSERGIALEKSEPELLPSGVISSMYI